MNLLFLLQEAHLLQALKHAVAPGGLYTLVVDKQTEPVLMRVIAKDTLLRIFASIEQLASPRKQQPFLLAVYFVHALVFNFNCIAADAHARRYKAGHLLLVPHLPWDEDTASFFRLDRFLANPAVSAYLGHCDDATYVPASMYPLEQRVFLADAAGQNSMPVYYNENCGDLVLAQVRKSAKAIVNAVVAAGEYPLLRFYSLPEADHQAARLPELLADEVQRQLDDYARRNTNYPPPSVGEKQRAVLLICDRTLDLYAPLLHEFTYQAMAMDIVPELEREGRYTYTTENERGETQDVVARLDVEDDGTWVAVRHMHIVEASEVVVGRIDDLIKRNPMMVDRSRAKTSADLMYVVAHLQGFDEERRQATLHKSLIDECLAINAARKLAEFAADFEQTCCAGGTLFEGVRNTRLADDLVALLARADLHVNDKVRLVLIYALYRGGLAQSDFIKLAKFIGVKDSQATALVQRCFFNLHKLGFPVVKSNPQERAVHRKTFHTINNDGTYNTSRFAPGIKRVLLAAARFELDADWFPYFRDKPLEDDAVRGPEKAGLLRNPRIRAQWAPTAKAQTSRSRQRVFCFVAGGITYLEMRAVYELSEAHNKDFFLGSETILKPRDFLIGVQNSDQVKLPGDLALDIVAETSGPVRAPSFLLEEQKPPSLAQSNVLGERFSHGSQNQVPQRQELKSPGKKVPSNSVPLPAHYRMDGKTQEKEKKSRLKRFFK